MAELKYRGDGLPPDGDESNSFPYVAAEPLKQAVAMAIELGRPLLVKGPPGCGKTRLAASVAHELGLELFEWYVKSTSEARDGLYSIDMIRRLQDSHMDDPRAQRLGPYIRFGGLGKAIRSAKRAVVLIDEIDKADIDFPNDLLRELEEAAFTIEELDQPEEPSTEQPDGLEREYRAAHRPIVIITSNDEKELPDAFLRRCLFHYIEFPGKDDLERIVEVNVSELDALEAGLVAAVVQRLGEIRDLGDYLKAPATSELIDWVRILHAFGADVAAVEAAESLADLPHWDVLFKHRQDAQRFVRAAEEAAG